MASKLARLYFAILVIIYFGSNASAAHIDTVVVGNSGNLANVFSTHQIGAVSYAYRIGRTEVTNAVYAEFLNAVAISDPFGLYNTKMSVRPEGGDCKKRS
jgi:formylglycine-generating enzyme